MDTIFKSSIGATNDIVFSDELNNEIKFVATPQAQAINYPNIEAATTEVVQVIDYPQLNGIYTKGYDENIGIYFIRDDGEYYFWDNDILGATLPDYLWRFESLITNNIIVNSPWINNQDLLIPSQGWRLLDFNSTLTPLKIIKLG